MVKPAPTQHVATNLALKLSRLAVMHNAADAAGLTERRDTIRRRMESIETEMTWHQAGSAEAAIVQLATARCINEMKPESEERETVNRVLASAMIFIEQVSGVTREAAGLAFYGSAKYDAELWI